jgi:transcriptional regulator with XRE-family HTH domain
MRDATGTRAIAEVRRRLRLGATQAEVAANMGWDAGTLSRVLSAKRGVSGDMMIRARDAGIPMEWWAECRAEVA